jgi:hypothetical protein
LISEPETMEVPWEEGARLINECTYLFATDLREIEELTLGLTIVEAKAQAPISTPEDTGPLASLRIGSRPIEEDETCRLFQLLFDRNHMIFCRLMATPVSIISMRAAGSSKPHTGRMCAASSTTSNMANGSAIAAEAIQRIGFLYGIEREIRGKPPSLRCEVRQARARPLMDDLEPELYLRHVLERVADHPINRIHEFLPWNVADALPTHLIKISSVHEKPRGT